jgi:hypothetical protein
VFERVPIAWYGIWAAFFHDLIQRASIFVLFHAKGSRSDGARHGHFLPMPAVASRIRKSPLARGQSGVQALDVNGDSTLDWWRLPFTAPIALPDWRPV